MTRRIAWLAALLAGLAGLAVLLVALAFVPIGAWEPLVVVAVVVVAVATALAGLVAAVAVNRLLRPLRQLARALDRHALGEEALRGVATLPGEATELLDAVRQVDARLRATVEALQRDRAQLATILEHMADGVLVLDAEERVQLANPAALRLLRQATATGRRLVEVARDAEVIDVARAARPAHPVARVVELVQAPRQGRRWVQVIAAALPGARRTLLVLQDVTELRRAEAARRDFVANVSHELRTPIASLKALVETLEGGALDDPDAGPDFLRRIHVEIDGLAHLVSELLELARVESGRVALEIHAQPASDLLFEAVERMRPFAERAGLLVAALAAGTPATPVLADRQRIGQVLANLLANAVKFTPPGGRIAVGARDRPGAVEFWVADTGVGIAPEELVRVFERFYKADRSRAGGGTGLGLAICKHLVMAHGGAIWAESAGEGQGATFHFTLPRAPAEVPAGERPARPVADPTAR